MLRLGLESLHLDGGPQDGAVLETSARDGKALLLLLCDGCWTNLRSPVQLAAVAFVSSYLIPISTTHSDHLVGQVEVQARTSSLRLLNETTGQFV